MRRQGKRTYTVTKAYRVISLLSCFGKVVEKAVATCDASCCEITVFFHRGQRRVVELVARVENAWAKKRTALALLLDVKGTFEK